MIHLEDLSTHDATDRNFTKLKALVIETGGISLGLRTREDTIVWPGGSPNTTVLTVDHGLATVPVTVLLTPRLTLNLILMYDNLTATTFTVQGRTEDGSSPAAATARVFSWLAFG